MNGTDTMEEVHSLRRARHARHHLNRHGFSLVELLVVISIISILASLLLPVLQKARMMAHCITCLNNQKQLYLGQNLYGDDSNGAITPLVGHNPPKSCWRNLLVDYLQVKVPETTWQRTGMYSWTAYVVAADKPGPSLIVCPGDPRTRDLSISLEHDYFQNEWLGWNNGTVSSLYPDSPHAHTRRYGQVRSPSRIIMWIEKKSGSFVGGSGAEYTPGNALGLWHFGGNNMVYVDGHAETMPVGVQFIIASGVSGGIDYWKACSNSVHSGISIITGY